MKIATILGAFSLGSRPLDLATAHTSDRGMTGTELGFVRVTEELRKLGHEVVPFMGDREYRREWTDFDALLSWNEPMPFAGSRSTQKRVVFQMLNDFSFCPPHFDRWVDKHVGVSRGQVDHIVKHYPQTAGRWAVVPLGCDPELYEDRRVQGRVVYASSPDRGLHWLLSAWPEIRKAVPEAHLRVFYHWSDDLLHITETSVSPQGGPYHPHIVEIAQRKRYIKRAMEALQPLGVEWVGSVSRARMAKEWSEASVMAYPCDTVALSEGFSVSILEAHASFTAPVITDVDCLGEVYAGSGAAMVRSPVQGRMAEFTEEVVTALRGGGRISACRAFAQELTWAKTAKRLEEHLQ